ncbi:MAG TPA: MFS transporter, partial [Euzebya sp.]|nr:MFS transporter [Euzebya sp.]
NAAMIILLPDDNLGFRLSLLSVALWWAGFSIPLARHVPEPPAHGEVLGTAPVRAALRETMTTLRGLSAFPDLRRYLIAFIIYNDGINVVIAAAAIYGVELGFAPLELTLAILLVQFVGAPYAMVFGAMPATSDRQRRRVMTAFVVANIVLLPLLGIALRVGGPPALTGAPGPRLGDEGVLATDPPVRGGVLTFDWDGQSLRLTHRQGPGLSDAQVQVDGESLLADGEPVVVPGAGAVDRSGEVVTIQVDDIGPHTLTLPGAEGLVEQIEVLPARRSSSLPVILALIIALQAVGAAFALSIGGRLVAGLADRLTTKRAIMISLSAYVVIAVWGFALDSVVEFWCLAWMVGVVQGGSQALSRSLYARLTPPRRSGEFFGFFSILSKFASFFSPLVFAGSVALFDSSRPAVLTLSLFFITGMMLLRRVDVERGEAQALATDAPDAPAA